MIAISKAVYKEVKHVDGYMLTVDKKDIEVKEHYDLIVDESSNNRVNQQKLFIDANNQQLVAKLDNLARYSEIYLIVDFEYYKTKLAKARVIDIVTDATEKQVISEIFKRY